MSMQPCDHTSVGILVFRNDALLLIDRKKPPFGLAAPAGHVDAHGAGAVSEAAQFEQAAREELQEETGLTATSLRLITEGRKDTACRRPEGSWHYWRIYEADTTGELHPSVEETSGALWATRAQMETLLSGGSVVLEGREVKLEPVWMEWFKELDVLSRFG
jgi:8-oxo-dGTP pyrophosphatase MutT (NUDIX family)